MTAKHPVAITVVGNDRPGIVAAVTKVLFEQGCNLEDVTSTILRGHFAMMLIVHVPLGRDIAALEAKLGEVAREKELVVTIRHVDEAQARVAAPTHMVSVYGADRPGIVYKVAELLAARGNNITDLTSRVIGEEDSPVYALLLEVNAAQDKDLESALGALREELGVEVSVHSIDPDVL